MGIAVVIIFVIIWIVGSFIYFYYKNNKPTVIGKAIIKGKNYNQFLPDDNQVKDLTVNIVFDEKPELEMSKYCDLVIKAKDLINNNIKNIAKNKNDIFSNNSEIEALGKKEEIKIKMEKLTDINFNKLIKINQITNI